MDRPSAMSRKQSATTVPVWCPPVMTVCSPESKPIFCACCACVLRYGTVELCVSLGHLLAPLAFALRIDVWPAGNNAVFAVADGLVSSKITAARMVDVGRKQNVACKVLVVAGHGYCRAFPFNSTEY